MHITISAILWHHIRIFLPVVSHKYCIMDINSVMFNASRHLKWMCGNAPDILFLHGPTDTLKQYRKHIFIRDVLIYVNHIWPFTKIFMWVYLGNTGLFPCLDSFVAQ